MQGYTLPQVEVFLAGIEQEERRQARVMLIAARAAKAKQDKFNKILKEMG